MRLPVLMKLHFTITMVFIILTLPVTAFIVIENYRSNELLIADTSERFIQDSVRENIANVTKLFNPMLSTAATFGTIMHDKPEYFREEGSADYLHEIVVSNEAVYSAYAGFEDGYFRQVRRAVPGKVLGKDLPAGTKLVSRYITVTPQGVAVDHYDYNADWRQRLAQDAGPATYDVRKRDFYKAAIKSNRPAISDPYIFASSGELGITVTAPVAGADGKPIGVAAIDLTLKTFSNFLAANRVSEHGLTIISDDMGGIVAHPQYELDVVNKPDGMVRNQLAKLQDPRVLNALAERLRTGRDRFVYRAGPGNQEYIGIFSPFPKDFKKPWELLTIAPVDDFAGRIKAQERYLLVFGLLAFCFQILMIDNVSRSISRPMEQLAVEVTNIRSFRFGGHIQTRSHVSEVKYLFEAVDLLEKALKSFTSYVPRGLVQDLTRSGIGTTLGVESRYLTILFTDLEGFSTLSETEPSQQLLARVSQYFAAVTDAIEHENGTVDKFIGDAVMAFWGAPSLVHNHAYMACVAAVRAQRRMTVLNGAWRAEGLTPLTVRIGIHSDAVMVGNVGSNQRMSYSVMGDGVNVASRLEGVNKEWHTLTCISHNVFREAGERLWLRPVDVVTVKGRKGGMLIYNLLAVRDADEEVAATPDEMRLCELTTVAYAHYAASRIAEAASAYRTVLNEFPNDGVAQRMLAQCQWKKETGAQ
ncbi:MAG: hypothetical protein JO218_10765 [Burkholderiales bacterium]|nr:hypothetical protein [Burkholderiales bacterium]